MTSKETEKCSLPVSPLSALHKTLLWQTQSAQRALHPGKPHKWSWRTSPLCYHQASMPLRGHLPKITPPAWRALHSGSPKQSPPESSLCGLPFQDCLPSLRIILLAKKAPDPWRFQQWLWSLQECLMRITLLSQKALHPGRPQQWL